MKYFFPVILLLLLSVTSYSQPQTIIIFSGGYNLPLPDLYGKFGDTRETFTGNGNPYSNSYFFTNGINFGLQVKHALNKQKRFRITGGFIYNLFSQNKEYSGADGISIEYSLNILQMSAGVGYSFITKKSKVNPFAELEGCFNLFSGSYKKIPLSGDEKTMSLNSTYRIGFNAGAGVDFVMGQRMGAVLGFKYNFANLIGKKSEGDSQNNYNINDKEEIINGITYKNRNITYLLFYAGLSFYFGI